MFAKPTITLFVLAVGLLSFLSGSASAHPRPDELTINRPKDGEDSAHLFEAYWKRSKENSYSAGTYLSQNAIQGSNSHSKNILGSDMYENHVVFKGTIPTTGQNFGAVTVGSYNAIQQSDSNSTNVLGSKVVMNDVIYDFKNNE